MRLVGVFRLADALPRYANASRYFVELDGLRVARYAPRPADTWHVELTHTGYGDHHEERYVDPARQVCVWEYMTGLQLIDASITAGDDLDDERAAELGLSAMPAAAAASLAELAELAELPRRLALAHAAIDRSDVGELQTFRYRGRAAILAWNRRGELLGGVTAIDVAHATIEIGRMLERLAGG